jgi:lysozyme family protein
MTSTVREIAQEIVGREGGFVNDPDDPGGATNYGVTIHTMRALGLDLDKDGDVDVRDVKLLTMEQAVDIFIKHYFEKPQIWRLPEELHATVFDMQVNAGLNAIKILQNLVNRVNKQSIAVDGQIGPATAGATMEAASRIGAHNLAHAYSIERRNYYYRLADRRAASRKYARRRDGGKGGWITRAEEFLPDQYRLTDAEHRQRTAKWG